MPSSDSILLVQVEQNPLSKTFSYHPSVEHAVGAILDMYEHRLKVLNPDQRNLSYSLRDIHSFVDRCPEFGVLVFDDRIKAFVPHDKNWIKERVARKLVRN